jgi:hypothetical protein
MPGFLINEPFEQSLQLRISGLTQCVAVDFFCVFVDLYGYFNQISTGKHSILRIRWNQSVGILSLQYLAGCAHQFARQSRKFRDRGLIVVVEKTFNNGTFLSMTTYTTLPYFEFYF